VPVVILMSAAIDACALRLQLRYVEEWWVSDMPWRGMVSSPRKKES
jgi:hypothetical protein